MTPEELQQAKSQRPFQPFRVVLATGDAYEVRHAELIMVGRQSALIGIADNPAARVYDRTVKLDLGDIVAIQALPVKPTTTNGPAA